MTAFRTPSGHGLADVQEALRRMDLEGWLLYDFHGRNPVADSLLGARGATRRTFVLLPARGEPRVLRHVIEASSWRDWPWDERTYRGWQDLEEGLAGLLEGCRAVAMEFSGRSAVPTLDLVPGGVLELVRESGVEVVSSGDLVSLFHCRWSAEQLARHHETARILREVALETFQRAATAVRAGSARREGELADWIRARLPERGVREEVDCIVAVGRNAADPHYQPPPGGGELAGKGELLLIDLWGKPAADDVPADQTWMGFLGGSLPARYREVWDAVRDARDRALQLLAEGRTDLRGWEVDDACRGVLRDRGFGPCFLHRTGHSIDRSLHGSGPNLDNLETRDERRLLPGVGFSVEPGVYIEGEVGMRSEVNVHLGPEGPEVTTPEPQREVLLLLDD